jgi:hypothetical protein
MGYTTEFEGAFFFDKPLKEHHVEYLKKFADTRRMARNFKKASMMADPLRERAELPIGTEGAFFVGGIGFAGQEEDDSIIDYNRPPKTQPSLWCKWVASDDGTRLLWNGAEKFYAYLEWLQYLIDTFFGPWGYNLNGKVEWQGEDPHDVGTIIVDDNKIINTTKLQTSYD